MFISDLPEVIQGIIREVEPAGWIAEASPRSPRQAIRCRCHSPVAASVQLKVDVAPTRISNIYPRRISLVEHVEEASPELKLLSFAEVEVLEERNIEITPARRPYIKWRLRRPRVSKRRNLQLTDVKDLASQRRALYPGIAKVDRCYCTCALAVADECIGAPPRQPLAGPRQITAKPQANWRTGLKSRYTRHLPTIKDPSGDSVIETPTRKFRQVVVIREIEDVGAVKRQDAPASSTGIDWVSPRRSIGLISRHRSQGLGERVGCEVLEVFS